MTSVVELKGATVSFRLPRTSRSIKSLAIREKSRPGPHLDRLALRDIDLNVGIGEVIAIVGRNGAGKSTLLRLCGRILPPSSGRVVVRGSVAPMIELGAGFSQELTGSENVVLYGTLLGRKPKEMRERIDEIASWAGLTEHMDLPLRAYSSGMVARLAFAVATDVTPDLLLIDEVLSVGDADFQAKSEARTRMLIASGAAVILVTHDLDVATSLATRGVWLEQGRVSASGPVDEVVAKYVSASRLNGRNSGNSLY